MMMMLMMIFFFPFRDQWIWIYLLPFKKWPVYRIIYSIIFNGILIGVFPLFCLYCSFQTRLFTLVELLVNCSSRLRWHHANVFFIPHYVLIYIDGRKDKARTLPVLPGRWSPRVNVRSRYSITANYNVWSTFPQWPQLLACTLACWLDVRVLGGEKWEIKLYQMLNYGRSWEESWRRVRWGLPACLDCKQWEPAGLPLSKLFSILLFAASLRVCADLITAVTTSFLSLSWTSHLVLCLVFRDFSAVIS